MRVEKLTEEYILSEEGNNYSVNFGKIEYGVPVRVSLKFTEVNSKVFNVARTCGCSLVETTTINEKTAQSLIQYDAKIRGVFNKTIVITNGKERKELKLTGITE